jgi:hypothetical protein
MAIKTFTTGEVLTAADTNTYLANSGLVYVGQTTATSGTTLDLSNCFSSTYDAYRIVLSDIRLAGSGSINFQLMNGTTPATTNYAWAFTRVAYDSTTSINGSGYPSYASTWITSNTSGTVSSAFSMDVFNPFLAQVSYYQCNATDNRGVNGYGLQLGGGTQYDATSYSSMRFTLTASTISNITATCYGYRKA